MAMASRAAEFGGGGDDTLLGGDGNDSISGGKGTAAAKIEAFKAAGIGVAVTPSEMAEVYGVEIEVSTPGGDVDVDSLPPEVLEKLLAALGD